MERYVFLLLGQPRAALLLLSDLGVRWDGGAANVAKLGERTKLSRYV
jgi:hypothetical protein